MHQLHSGKVFCFDRGICFNCMQQLFIRPIRWCQRGLIVYKLSFWLLRHFHGSLLLLELCCWPILFWNGGDEFGNLYRLYRWKLRFLVGFNFMYELRRGYLFDVNCHYMLQLCCRDLQFFGRTQLMFVLLCRHVHFGNCKHFLYKLPRELLLRLCRERVHCLRSGLFSRQLRIKQMCRKSHNAPNCATLVEANDSSLVLSNDQTHSFALRKANGNSDTPTILVRQCIRFNVVGTGFLF